MSGRHRQVPPPRAPRQSATALMTVPVVAGSLITGQMGIVPARAVRATTTDAPSAVPVVPSQAELAFDLDRAQVEVQTARAQADAERRTQAEVVEAAQLAQAEAERLAADLAERKARAQREAEADRQRPRPEPSAVETPEAIAQIAAEAPEPEGAPDVETDVGEGDVEAVVAFARGQMGEPYVWGGTGPDGWDCSGLMQAAFRKAGVGLPRVSGDQARRGVAVSATDARPGDLVVFGSPVHHVGLYLGEGRVLHAPRRGDVVKVSEVWGDSTRYRRVL